jgi:acrylyl-CoA reductase (NADPH)
MTMFKAILLSQSEDKKTRAELLDLDESRLPDRDVTVAVEYSTLNYKDALAITGRGAVVRNWPLVPGIDLAGTVSASRSADWKAGDKVVATGWGLGENHWGGLAQRARLDAGWLLKIPAPFTTRSAMTIATAGFTAALCVMALQRHGLKPGDGEVLVTGAVGGVGSVAVALLGSLGYTVVASTGRPQEADYLQCLGARRIVERGELAQAGKPLQKEVWAGVVDTAGSHTLANACAQTRFYGAVAACGLAQGGDFPTTVMPFILRGVTLYGINSVLVPNSERVKAWALMAEHLDAKLLDAMTVEIGLSEAIAYAPRLIEGQVRGRTVVNVAR